MARKVKDSGSTPVTNFRLSPGVLGMLDMIAAHYGLPSRTAVIMFLVQQENRRIGRHRPPKRAAP